MPWCPDCGTEYREGFAMCKDCHVALNDSPPDVKTELPDVYNVRETLLTIVRDELEFARIESLMAEVGIPVLKKHHGSGEYLELYMGASPYGIEVYVPYGAHTRAKALLSGDESAFEVTGEVGDDTASSEFVVMDVDEEKELHRYLHAVNEDMYKKKQSIAMVMLLSIGAGVIWTVYSILKEMF